MPGAHQSIHSAIQSIVPTQLARSCLLQNFILGMKDLPNC